MSQPHLGEPDRKSGSILLGLSAANRTDRIFPRATFPGTAGLINLEQPLVIFNTLTSSQRPPFEVHSDGVIRALRPGHALLETSYGPFHQFTCVTVVPKDNGSELGSDCAELLPAETQLGAPPAEHANQENEEDPHVSR